MLAPSVGHYVLARDDGQPLDFRPGQFIQVHFTGADGAPRRRSYSLATRHDHALGPGEAVEIAVSYLPGGAATALFEALEVGGQVQASGPYGRFCLVPGDSNRRYLLIATGTGVTPYRSMLPVLAQRKPDSVLLAQAEREVLHAQLDLRHIEAALIAAIAAEMGIPDCECRKRHAERMQLRLGSLQQMQAQLSDLIRTQYLDMANPLLRELRIFSGANALAFALLAFALLGVAALRRPGARLQLLPATATLLLATLATSGVYLFGQDWLHTIVFGDYMGWALLGYIALVYAWLCDLLFNRAQLTARLLSSAGGAVAPC